MDLSGLWRTAPADEALRRVFHDPVFDDGTWSETSVPGHWGADSQFAANRGPFLYRTSFNAPSEIGEGRRRWLVFDGIFAQGDAWLDGHYLGDTDGWFVPHEFEVSSLLADRTEHQLAVEVACSPGGEHGKRRGLLGVFEGGNEYLRAANPGGIWRPVRIEESGPVRLRTLRAICSEASATAAVVTLRATLEAVTARSVTLRTMVAGRDHESEEHLAEGSNEVEWTITVPSPQLWWPRHLGEQPLHDLTVQVETRADEISDERTLRLGFRSVSMRKFLFRFNDEPLHLKGINLAPTSDLPGLTSTADLERDLDLVTDAGLDMIRPYAHVAHPDLYRLADERGLVVWQDLPLHGDAANSLRGPATQQARVMVDLLGHHPSIAVWCGHVTPSGDWMEAGDLAVRRRASRLAAHQLPTWTKSVLDRSIKHTLQNNDPSRPALAFSGVLPHLPRLEGTATHLWFGWRRGNERDIEDFARRLPSQVRFVSEFGAQAVPAEADFLDSEAFPQLDWDALAEHQGMNLSSFQRYVPPVGHRSLAEWTEASQLYQAVLVRRQVEALRRLKYRPNGGFCVSLLADSQPAISTALLDHQRRPKRGYQALIDACRPVIVVADRLPARVRPGDALALDIHVVNDRREELVDAVVDVTMSWPEGSQRWRFGGSLEADAVTRVGTVSWVADTTEPGPLTLTLVLSGPAHATNRYDASLHGPS